ncbi:hypothetical protein ACSUZJ_09275 [Telluria sp. B2]
MKDALTPNYAASQAPGQRLARLARRGLAVCMLACVGLGAAHAQSHGRRDDIQLPPPPQMRPERFPAPAPQIEQPREQRMVEQQRAMEDQQRRQAAQMQQEQGMRDGRRGGRLTPDERRDLRRQINEAGIDIYPNAQRR